MGTGELYDQLVAEHFDRDFFQLNRDCRALALRQIGQNRESGPLEGLDLGMGTGEFLRSLHSQYPEGHWVGLEISKKMIERAEEKLSREGLKDFQIHYGSAEDLQSFFGPGTFDLVALHFILNYVNHSRVLEQIHRVLRPGGLFSLSTTTGDSFPTLHALASQFTSEEFIQSQFNVPANREEIKEKLTASGLDTLAAETYEKSFQFEDFDHLTDFALHSGWWANDFFLSLTPEQISLYREFSKNIFPLAETFRAAVILAKKI